MYSLFEERELKRVHRFRNETRHIKKRLFQESNDELCYVSSSFSFAVDTRSFDFYFLTELSFELPLVHTYL